jgi:hypothetical protein
MYITRTILQTTLTYDLLFPVRFMMSLSQLPRQSNVIKYFLERTAENPRRGAAWRRRVLRTRACGGRRVRVPLARLRGQLREQLRAKPCQMGEKNSFASKVIRHLLENALSRGVRSGRSWENATSPAAPPLCPALPQWGPSGHGGCAAREEEAQRPAAVVSRRPHAPPEREVIVAAAGGLRRRGTWRRRGQRRPSL